MKNAVLFFINFIMISVCAQSNIINEIPFRLEQNHIFISVKINQSDSLKFLFDTGADATVLNTRASDKISLNFDGTSTNVGSNGVNEVQSSSGNEIQLGDISIENVAITAIDFGTNKFDGIIGTDLMQNQIIAIDYHQKMLIFYKNNDINFDLYDRVKLYSDIYPTYIKSEIKINNKSYKGIFGLDTGAIDAVTLTSSFVNKNEVLHTLEQAGSVHYQGSDGSIYELNLVYLPEISLGSKQFYRIPAALSNATEGIDASEDLVGFFGNAFLKRFNIILDYQNHWIYFQPNQNLHSEF